MQNIEFKNYGIINAISNIIYLNIYLYYNIVNI